MQLENEFMEYKKQKNEYDKDVLSHQVLFNLYNEMIQKELEDRPGCIPWNNYKFSICTPKYLPEGEKIHRKYILNSPLS